MTDTGTRFLSCMTGLCSHAAPRGTSHTPPSPRAHATHASAHTHIPRTRAALAMPAEALASTSVAGYRLSNDQLRYYSEHGLLVVKGHPGIAPSLESVRRHEGDREVSRCALEQYAEDLLALPDSPRSLNAQRHTPLNLVAPSHPAPAPCFLQHGGGDSGCCLHLSTTTTRRRAEQSFTAVHAAS